MHMKARTALSLVTPHKDRSRGSSTFSLVGKVRVIDEWRDCGR